jgi:DnaJ like chaperone protein
MSWNGKITGLLIGSILGKPLFMILCVVIGHFYDNGLLRRWFGLGEAGSRAGSFSKQRAQTVFFNVTFQTMGYVAKSDGRVSESEIVAARRIMEQMGLNEAMRQEAIRLFEEGKQASFNLDVALDKLKRASLSQRALLRMFLEIQIQMASAEGRNIGESKRRILQYICQYLGVAGFQYSQFEQQFRNEQSYYQHRYQARENPKQFLGEAYELLGITSNATDIDMKKAYRKKMSQHHPDKLIAKGLPPEMIKVATQKTQQIKSAYDQIKKARGL